MADQPNVFDTPKPAEGDQPPAPAPSPDAFADLLSRVTNEDGKPKYKTIEDALVALEHSQKFIPQLQSEAEQARQEAAALKAQVEKFGTVEDVIKRLTAGKNQDGQDPEDKPVVSGLDETAAKGLFEQMLNERTVAETAKTNQATVQKALTEKFGEKTSEVVAQKAKELGTTPADLGALASKNPLMVMALFGTQAAPSPKPTVNSVSTTFNKPGAPELPKPTKSLLSGATSKEQAEHMRQIKEYVYKKHGITTN